MLADYAIAGSSQSIPMNGIPGLPAGIDPALYLAAAAKGKLNGIHDFGGYPYGDEEEPTDEARTNEEAYEELQQQLQGKAYGQRVKGVPGNGNCIFFNEALDDQISGDDDDDQSSDQEDDEDDQDEGELEDGEFDPNVIACQNIDG